MTCPICHAKDGEECRNTITPDAPLPGRGTHYARHEYCLRCGIPHDGKCGR